MPAASQRTVERKRAREEAKRHGRALTDDERRQVAIADQSQFQREAFQKALNFREIIVTIHDEMTELLRAIPCDRAHKAERAKLSDEIAMFQNRVRGARAFVIDTGLALIEGVPNNPAEPPPEPPLIRSASMEEAAALAKQKANIEASIK